MRNVTCPHCQQTVSVPDDLASAHCVRCGQAFALETNIRADAPQALPSDAFSDRPITTTSLPDRWSSWDEFRANSPAVQRELMQLVARPLPDMRRMTVLPVPEDAPPEIDDWDRPVATIKIPGTAQFSGDTVANRRIIAVVLLCIAIVYSIVAGAIWLSVRDRGPEIFGIGAMFLFACLVVWGRPQPTPPTTVWVFEDGLYIHRYGRSKVTSWTDVLDFAASNATGRPLYWLTIAHDLTIPVSLGFSPEILTIMEYVEIRLSAAQFLRRLEKIWDGHSQRFGIITLNRDGLQTPRFFSPWSEVRRVVSDTQSLFVDRASASDWAPVPYRNVSFPYLVMAISHVLIDEHARFPKVDA